MYLVQSTHDHAENLTGVDRVFALDLWEPVSVPKSTFLLNSSLTEKKIPLTLILNSWARHLPVPDCDVLYVDYFLWRTYNEIVNRKKSQVNPVWNYNSKQFLCLTGKPQKINRIGLLHLLHTRNLSKNAVTSLFVHSGNRHETRSILSHLSDEEFDNFVANYNHSPDNPAITVQKRSIHYGGIPYSVELFAKTKFRVISETNMHLKPAWITEKTWITILNRQPFLIAGDYGTCAKLSAMGFKTFDEYLITPYDHKAHPKQRLEAMCNNITHWLNDGLPQDLVANDVEHNYQQLIKLANKNKTTIEDYLTKVNIVATVDDIISTLDDITNT
jgi:hypothetical protein